MASVKPASENILPLTSAIFLVVLSLVFYLFHKPTIPKNAPQLIKQDTVPLIGTVKFFTHRLEFMRNGVNHSPTGHFSFYVGQHPVVGVSGRNIEGRRVFFEDRRLGLAEGYGALSMGAPEVKKDNSILGENNATSDFSRKFGQRLTAVMKGSVLRDTLPQLLTDLRDSLDQLAQQQDKIIDPFDTLYHLVFTCIMRTTACSEVASSPKAKAHILSLFEGLDAAKDSGMIMYPWLPTPSKLKRLFYGSKLYMIFKKIIDDRKAEGRRANDTLQYLIDQGDNVTDIITFVLGALSAGQINGGINTAALLCYLAANPKWMTLVRHEIATMATKYAPAGAATLPLKDALMHVPIEAWEADFHTIDVCLRETMRLQLCGTMFRQNISGSDVVLDKQTGEVIPPGFFAAMAIDDIHMDEDVYRDAGVWDPERYLEDRAEDKKKTYAWMGWGVARHPCLGMRLAKLETTIIIALFLAYFENVQTCDELGNLKPQTPHIDRERYSAHKPKYPIYLKCRARQNELRES